MYQLITPASRAKITHKLAMPPHRWKGTRKGVQIALTLSQQPTLDNYRFTWSYTRKEETGKGTAPTAGDAIQQIEAHIAASIERERRKSKAL